MLRAKWEKLGDCSPLAALKSAGETKWLIDGVIASGSLNWMVAAPSSFKTFVALDMATCISTGRAWHGRETKEAVVLYIAGEGDTDVHVRRAAAEMAAGDAGLLAIAQVRPRLDTPEGLPALKALISRSTSGCSLLFDEVDEYDYDFFDKYLSEEEYADFSEQCRNTAKVAAKPFKIPEKGADETHAEFVTKRDKCYAEHEAEQKAEEDRKSVV